MYAYWNIYKLYVLVVFDKYVVNLGYLACIPEVFYFASILIVYFRPHRHEFSWCSPPSVWKKSTIFLIANIAFLRLRIMSVYTPLNSFLKMTVSWYGLSYSRLFCLEWYFPKQAIIQPVISVFSIFKFI